MNDRIKDSINKSLQFSRNFWENPSHNFHFKSINESSIPWSFQKRWALYQQLLGIYDSLAGLDILDFGCGNGNEIPYLMQLGADIDRIKGIDINPNVIEQGKNNNPRYNITSYSGEAIPYADNSFDFSYSFLVFTSILSEEHRKFLASELIRVTKGGGYIFCFDLKYIVVKEEYRKSFDFKNIFFDQKLNIKDEPKYFKPSNGIRPLRGMKKLIKPFIDFLGYEAKHTSVLIGPIKK